MKKNGEYGCWSIIFRVSKISISVWIASSSITSTKREKFYYSKGKGDATSFPLFGFIEERQLRRLTRTALMWPLYTKTVQPNLWVQDMESQTFAYHNSCIEHFRIFQYSPRCAHIRIWSCFHHFLQFFHQVSRENYTQETIRVIRYDRPQEFQYWMLQGSMCYSWTLSELISLRIHWAMGLLNSEVWVQVHKSTSLDESW